ncbi:MAG TPA: carboxy terminal-processing peptidase [Cyclobacteriaceae bacterium]|nr:carboxy terminal-processing peptidase [Cyclobacteriaceae bacterium]
MSRSFAVVGVFLVWVGLAVAQDSEQFKPKPVFGKEARVISYVLDNNHYRKIKLNDSLSAAILVRYITELDNSKTYFLASDVKSFDRYKYSIDDLTRNENVTPAFEIYKVYDQRYKERMNYVLTTLVNQNFDYSIDEYYEPNREKATWATSKEELNEIWRKIIKSQALSLKLAGKKPDEITETLKTRYQRFAKTFSQFTSEDVFGIYMNSITEAYDPHTNYMSPKQSDLFKQQMSLSLEGIGAQLQSENDYTKIVRILPGGDAQKSGKVNENDLIIAVAQGKDGEMVDVVGWRLDDVVKLIKGPKGTVVRLMILPAKTGVNGPAQEVVLVRDKIKLEDQAAKKEVINYQLNGRQAKLGVISLPSFYMDYEAYQKGDPNYKSTTRDVKQLVGELKAEGVDGIVMDLRNNGGGSLPEAVDLTGLFIKNGPVVQVKNSSSKIDVLADDDKEIFYSGPLVVLTNRFSASASEIFAGAIQDYQRGVVVGEPTFGKGTVQTVLDLSRFINDDEPVGDLKLTFQKFYRVTGSSTQHKGVSPDISLPSAFDAEHFGESASPSALPWDVIRAASFQKTTDVNERVVAALNKSYQDRVRYDANLKKFISETDILRKNINETRISLNENKRKQEMADAEEKKAAEKLDTKVTSKEGLPVNELQNMKDEYLREGLLILGELVTKRFG